MPWLYPTSDRYMEYAISTSRRLSRNGPPSWKILRLGKTVLISLRIASNQAFSLERSSEQVFTMRASMSLARCKALVYVTSVKARSFPIARSHTWPRDLGDTPRHQSSRVRGSRTTRSQLGRTCSSQMRRRADFVSSWTHWTSAAFAAFLLSNDTL